MDRSVLSVAMAFKCTPIMVTSGMQVHGIKSNLASIL